MRESNVGNDLKEMAQEVVRFGERCVQAGRDWLNERREEMNHRNDDSRRGYQSGREYGQGGGMRGSSRQSGGQYGSDDTSRAARGQQSQTSRATGEYYGEAQFDERMQGTNWKDRGDWDYEGGPERYGASGYGETSQQDYRQGSGRRDYGSQASASDYYRGRQGYGQGSFGSEYSTDDRSEGYGEGPGYTRTSTSQWQGSQRGQGSQFSGRQSQGGSGRYGREGYGDRSSLAGSSQGYLDEGEMSGYSAREFGTQHYGSSRPAGYGASPGQYGGYGAGGGYRGVGPKNYKRSDERLTEDINERLTDDDDLDASNISVRVTNGKVTLEGMVDQRWMKHRAEDVVDACTGVTEIDNRIQVTSLSSSLEQTGETKASASRTSQSTATGTTTGTSTGAGGTISH
jgi:osmotically-inducible protein OsmY